MKADNKDTTMQKIIVQRTRLMALARWPLLSMLAALTMAPLTVKAELTQGRDYELVRPPKPTNDPNKIEVLEYFSYGCSHCYELYPRMSNWESKLAKDVVFVRSAVSVGFPQWVSLARAYYAFDYSDDLKRLDGKIFSAIHEQHINLFSDENVASWAAQQGLDKQKISGMLKSMGVDARVRQAEVDARSIPIDGTPTIIVDGKYRLIGANAKSYDDWLPLIDQLVAKARADKATVKKN
jgi:protein dithiol oxidoreductase (disulfide-forming)